MNTCELQQLRTLQQMLHSELRERDRLINQIDRRRRQAMRDAIEWAEAERRAKADQANDDAAAGDGGNALACPDASEAQ